MLRGYVALFLSFLFLESHEVSAGPVSGADSLITTPASGAPADGTIYGASDRTIVITAKDDGGSTNTTAALFAVEMYTSAASCDTNAQTPDCVISCSPYNSPHTSSPNCLSYARSYTLPQEATAHWVDVTNTVVDNGDGTYTAELLPEVSGTYDVSVDLLQQGGLWGYYYDNAWFANSPSQSRVDATINFQWGTGTLTAFGVDYISVRWEGKLEAVFSETYQISAYADDGVRVWIDRQLVIDRWDTCCQDTWASVALTAGKLHDIIIEYHEGTADATMELRWQSPSTARAIIPSSALYYRTPISGSPYANIVMGPGSADAKYSELLAPQYLTEFDLLMVAVAQNITLQARDVFNNDLEADTASAAIDVALTNGASDATTTSDAYASDGQYTLTFQATVALNYSLAITIDGSDILAGSPYSVWFSPGATDAPTSTAAAGSDASGDGLATASAGLTARFTVQPKDAQGNDVLGDTDKWAIQMGGANDIVGSCSWDTVNLLFDCWYTPIAAGSSSLQVFLNGVQIASSPFTVTVIGATVDVYTTTITTDLTSVTHLTGQANTFTTQLYDQFGNTVDNSGVTFVGAISGPDSAVISDAYVSAGAYTMTYSVTLQGSYSIDLTIGGVPIAGSPFSVVVNPNVAAATSTQTAPLSYVAGIQSRFQIAALDANLNVLLGDSSTFTVVLTVGGVAVSGTITYSGTPAVYDVEITPTKSGAGSLAMEVGGADIAGSPLTVTVYTGEAAGSTTTATGAGLTSCTAGTPCTFDLTAKDHDSNVLLGGGTQFYSNCSKVGETSITPVKTDNLDGTYSFTRTILKSGTWSSSITVRERPGSLLGQYYQDHNLGTLHTTRTDAAVDFDWAFAEPIAGIPADYFSAKWTGEFKVPLSGTFTFYTATKAYCGVRLYINGNLLIDQWDPLQGNAEPNGDVALVVDTFYSIELQFKEITGEAKIALSWSHPSLPQEIIPSKWLYPVTHVASSAYATVVAPGATDPATTTYSQTTWSMEAGVPTFTSGVPVVFQLQARDAHGNNQDAANDDTNFAVTLAPAAGSTDTDTGTITDAVEVTEGLWDVTFTPTIKGSRVLDIEYSSNSISTTPVTVNVLAGETSTTTSTSTLDGFSGEWIAGQETTFDIQGIDAAGNLLDTDDNIAPKEWTVASLSSYAISYVGAGLYRVTFTETAVADLNVGVLYNGVAITNSPFAVSVVPYHADASTSLVTGGAITGGASTNALTFVVEAKDVYDNAHVAGGYEFYVYLEDSAGALIRGAAADNNDGTYTVTYTPPTAGTWTAHVKVAQGTAAAGSGLSGAYYNNRWLSGTPEFTRTDATVDFNWGTDLVTTSAKDYVSVRWTGYIKPAYTSEYVFYAAVNDGCRLYIDDVLLVDEWDSADGTYTATHTFAVADMLYPITFELRENTGVAAAALSWSNVIGSLSAEIVPQNKLHHDASHLIASPFTVVVS